jgi:hypothetical protein
MIDCRAGAHLLGSCYSPQLLTSRKPNNDEAHSRVKAGVQAAEVNPLEMLDRQCPRVVETREPATETTLEDVLARNLSIRTPHARAPIGVYHPELPVLLMRGITLPEGAAASAPRPHLLTAALRVVDG